MKWLFFCESRMCARCTLVLTFNKKAFWTRTRETIRLQKKAFKTQLRNHLRRFKKNLLKTLRDTTKRRHMNRNPAIKCFFKRLSAIQNLHQHFPRSNLAIHCFHIKKLKKCKMNNLQSVRIQFPTSQFVSEAKKKKKR